MPRAIASQVRIVKLAQILSGESSPENRLKETDIMRSLEKQGLRVTRETLKSDIATLRKCGYDIKFISLPTGEYYYLDSGRRPEREIEEYVSIAVKNKTQLCVSLSGIPGEYLVSPYAILRNGAEYYTACYSPAHRRITLLPFAKLRAVHPTEVPVLPPPADYSSVYYTERGFELCQSTCETVILGFTDDAIGDVCERFGESVCIRCDSNGLLSAAVTTEVGASLFAWVFQCEGKVRIQSPDYVCREYKNSLRAQLAANC